MDLDAEHGRVVSVPSARRIAIVGAGPAGLMAAEVLAGAGLPVTIYERMPSPARKFLMAGRGGLNLTHSEPLDTFLRRYGETRSVVEGSIRAFPPAAVVEWCAGLGQEPFNGSSGRVFPKALKASPLLRAWLRRLDGLGVVLERGMTWTGWGGDGALLFTDRNGQMHRVAPAATLLALGGASWPRLGASGRWVDTLAVAGVPVTPLTASNAGALIAWSDIYAERFAGSPLKRIAITIAGHRVRGEAVVTRAGLEGGAVYALSPQLRQGLRASGGAPVTVSIDLRPDLDIADIERRLGGPRGKQSVTSFLRKSLHLAPADIGLLREGAGKHLPADPAALARLIKMLPLAVVGMAGLERAISSAGGVRAEAIDARSMLIEKPGAFVAGEMIDWDAPTGGYLLQATFSTAVHAAHGLRDWLAVHPAAAGHTIPAAV
ncbi:MAG: TIGR03862 family flavoprotein [Hyphomicrobium sp.]